MNDELPKPVTIRDGKLHVDMAEASKLWDSLDTLKQAELTNLIFQPVLEKATAQEAEIRGLKAEVERLREARRPPVQCYWDADDREVGHIDIHEILDARDWGEVAEIEHVAIVGTTFEAVLPPATDSETDDLFEVCEHTREAAEAKIAAEKARRAALNSGGDDG